VKEGAVGEAFSATWTVNTGSDIGPAGLIVPLLMLLFQPLVRSHCHVNRNQCLEILKDLLPVVLLNWYKRSW